MVNKTPDKNNAPKRREEEPTPPTERSFTSGYAVGLNLLSSVLVGVFIGLGLDVWLETKPLFILIFLLLGMAAGFRSIWVYMQSLDKRK